MIKKTLLSFCFGFFSIVLFAQDKNVEMADTMRSSGKIYVVVAVSLTILIGIFFYLIRIDKKLTRLEKESSTDQLITK